MEPGVCFELWETRSGNLIGLFATEDEARDAVRRAIAAHGAGYLDTLALGYDDDANGRWGLLAEGKDLVAWAHRPAPA